MLKSKYVYENIKRLKMINGDTLRKKGDRERGEDKMRHEKRVNEHTDEDNIFDGEMSALEHVGSITAGDDGLRIHCMSIIGQIEGHYLLPSGQKSTKYEHILPLLAAIEMSDKIDGLLFILNTVGGEVEAGLCIAEMIASMSKPTASLVLGGGHSIGVPLAVAAKRSFIVPSATMTLHPVRINGTLIGAPQTYYMLSKMQDRIVSFVTEHSGIKENDFRRLIMRPDEMANDIGTLLDGNEAVKIGLIDELGGLSSAIDAIRKMRSNEK